MTEKGAAVLAVFVIVLLGTAHAAYGYWTDRIGVKEDFAVVWPVEVEIEEETEGEAKEETGMETEKEAEVEIGTETEKKTEEKTEEKTEKKTGKDRAGDTEPDAAETRGKKTAKIAEDAGVSQGEPGA